jgi:hypothetical protein
VRRSTVSLLAGVGLGVVGMGAAPGEPGAPIRVNVVAAQPRSSAGRVAQAMGELPGVVRSVQGSLAIKPGLQLDEKDPEVVVTIDGLDHQELERGTDPISGKPTLKHLYRGQGSLQLGGQRLPLVVDRFLTEGAGTLRLDTVEYHGLSGDVAAKVSEIIQEHLDALRPERAQAGFTHRDLRVKTVEPGSPAEKAGLKLEDRIRRLDTEKKGSKMHDRIRSWWMEKAGTRVAVEIERDKQRQTLELVLLPRSAWGRPE